MELGQRDRPGRARGQLLDPGAEPVAEPSEPAAADRVRMTVIARRQAGEVVEDREWIVAVVGYGERFGTDDRAASGPATRERERQLALSQRGEHLRRCQRTAQRDAGERCRSGVRDGSHLKNDVRIRSMSARVIDGKAVAQEVRSEVRAEIEQWIADGGQRPGLATILVGEDPASAVYVSGKQRASVEVGLEGFAHDLPADATQAEVEALIRELNDDPRVSGILLQLPTPEQIDGSYLTTLIDASKDVDGLTPISAGLLAKGLPGLRPCTPAGVMELLRRNDVELTGAEAVVVGRSDLVGKPVAALLLAQHATVTICHSRTRNLGEVCRRADVLVAAVGRPEMVKGSWVKPGAAVIDVGINRTDAGLVGDVEFGPAAEVAGLITPVPGGVGPMTIAMLLRNTLLAAKAQAA